MRRSSSVQGQELVSLIEPARQVVHITRLRCERWLTPPMQSQRKISSTRSATFWTNPQRAYLGTSAFWCVIYDVPEIPIAEGMPCSQGPSPRIDIMRCKTTKLDKGL